MRTLATSHVRHYVDMYCSEANNAYMGLLLHQFEGSTVQGAALLYVVIEIRRTHENGVLRSDIVVVLFHLATYPGVRADV